MTPRHSSGSPEAGRFRMASAIGLRHPASASCLGRHSRLAGRCPNNSSLFPPLAAVVVVALWPYSAERLFLIEQSHNIGYVILLLEWALAILGIILNALFLSKKIVKIIGVISYVIMGWLILFTGGFIYMPLISFYLVLAGGISYTIGSVLYALGRKTNLWFHTIFHCFIVIGTIIQALGIIMMIS